MSRINKRGNNDPYVDSVAGCRLTQTLRTQNKSTQRFLDGDVNSRCSALLNRVHDAQSQSLNESVDLDLKGLASKPRTSKVGVGDVGAASRLINLPR